MFLNVAGCADIQSLIIQLDARMVADLTTSEPVRYRLYKPGRFSPMAAGPKRWRRRYPAAALFHHGGSNAKVHHRGVAVLWFPGGGIRSRGRAPALAAPAPAPSRRALGLPKLSLIVSVMARCVAWCALPDLDLRQRFSGHEVEYAHLHFVRNGLRL